VLNSLRKFVCLQGSITLCFELKDCKLWSKNKRGEFTLRHVHSDIIVKNIASVTKPQRIVNVELMAKAIHLANL